MKLSYIIPFYNGQDTIHHCLDSILAIGLDLNELEIIIVDDCSPISVESVLGEYIAKHPNIRIVRHKVNKRQGGAKNTGITLAKGKYIAFADQDDTIPSNNGVIKALEFAIRNPKRLLRNMRDTFIK
jgi:glycosyltransferase involved in cell wall biosynthesis